MEKLINFGFKIGASEIIFKSDGCQFVFRRSIDVRKLSDLCNLIVSCYDKDKYDITCARCIENRDEVLITVNPNIDLL